MPGFVVAALGKLITLFSVPSINIVAPDCAAVKEAVTAELVLKLVTIVFLPATEPPVIAPVVVIVPAPTSILVNPDVILPESNAPTDTKPVAVVIEFCVAVETVPAKLPVTFPVKVPINPVAVIFHSIIVT